MKLKKVAVVGCGRISERHIEAINLNKNLELSLICDIDVERSKKSADKLNINYVENISDISGVDLITIATPSGLHPKHVIEASEKCVAPIIICEKPISLTVRETVEMFNHVKKNGKKLLAVFQNRYNPLIEFIKKILLDNTLGKIYLFNVNIFWNRNDDYYKIGWHGTLDLDGGILYTQASHYVDMLLFFFGKLQEAKGFGGNLRKLEVLDTVAATLKFENGVVGSLNTTISTYRQNYQTELTLIGQNGTIRLSGTNLKKIDFWDVKNIKKPIINFENHSNSYIKLYNYIVNESFEYFPTYDEIISCISLMEKLSF